ncbi:MAG: ATP-binding cassette domain-containing protein [Bacteroidota bacterium]
MATLRVDHVTKRYGSFTAVDNVTFAAQEGRILGLLGPNGAGKTSSIRMITYITVPDEGQVTLGGQPVGPWSQERMGYLPEERGLYKKLKVGEQLVYLAELKGMSASEAKPKINYWLERFDAVDWKKKKVQELSKGMQQKVQFIATILHDPSLLILDEPFSGLDPLNSELLRDIIYELKDDGRTILFASHRMEQVEQLCDDICLIANGQILVNGPLRDVKRQFGRNTVTIEFDGDASFLDGLEREGLVRVGMRSHNRAEMRLLNATKPIEVMRAAMPHLNDLSVFDVSEPPLNEIFITLVEQQKAAQAA